MGAASILIAIYALGDGRGERRQAIWYEVDSGMTDDDLF